MRHIASISRVLPAKGALPLWKPHQRDIVPLDSLSGMAGHVPAMQGSRCAEGAPRRGKRSVPPHPASRPPSPQGEGKAARQRCFPSFAYHPSPQAPAAVAQAAKGQCGDFAEDCFRASGNSGNPLQPSRPALQPLDLRQKERGGPGGSVIASPRRLCAAFDARKRPPSNKQNLLNFDQIPP